MPSFSPLARGAALNLAARSLTVLLGLAILVWVARLGPEVQGAFALFAACESLLATLCSGLGLLLARALSQRGAAAARGVNALLCAAVVLGGLCALPLLALAAATDDAPYRHLWLLALAAPWLLLVPTASGLWLGQGRMLPLNAPLVAAPLAVLALLALLRPDAGAAAVLPVLAAWVAGKSLVGVLTALAARRDAALAAAPHPPAAGGDGDATALTALTAHWRFVATIGLTNAISLLNYRATLFLVERSAGLAEAGVYSVAVQLAELLWLLSSAVTVSAYHRIGAPDADAAARTTLAAVRVNLLATVAAAPLLYGACALLLPRVLGDAYAGALLPLALLLPGVAGYAAASSLSAWYTNQCGRPLWSAGIAGLSLAITLAIGAWSVPAHGAAGAALATSLAYAVAIAVALGRFLRDTGLRWRALWSGGAGRPQSRAA